MAPTGITGSPVYFASAGCHHNIHSNVDDDAYESCTADWPNAVHAVGVSDFDFCYVISVPVSVAALLVLQ
ncbi:hypothetical protein D3C74_429350 [compost metagenome]